MTLTGKRFKVVRANVSFPRDFHVVGEGLTMVRVANSVEEYVVSRVGFDALLKSGHIAEMKALDRPSRPAEGEQT